MATKQRTSKTSTTSPDSWTLVSPAGNEYQVTSAVDRYNLLARGYRDKDPDAAAKLAADAEAAATTQPATGTVATAANTGGDASR